MLMFQILYSFNFLPLCHLFIFGWRGGEGRGLSPASVPYVKDSLPRLLGKLTWPRIFALEDEWRAARRGAAIARLKLNASRGLETTKF